LQPKVISQPLEEAQYQKLSTLNEEIHDGKPMDSTSNIESNIGTSNNYIFALDSNQINNILEGNKDKMKHLNFNVGCSNSFNTILKNN
jgi:hypothetical protein